MIVGRNLTDCMSAYCALAAPHLAHLTGGPVTSTLDQLYLCRYAFTTVDVLISFLHENFLQFSSDLLAVGSVSYRFR